MSRKGLGVIPGAMIVVTLISLLKPIPLNGWEYLPERDVLRYPRIEAVGFLSNRPVMGIGEIVIPQYEGADLLSKGEIVYLSVGKEFTIKEGEEYQVVRNTMIRDSVVGYLVEKVGRIQIVDTQSFHPKAVIVKSFMAVNLGDRIVPYDRDDPKFSTEIVLKCPDAPIKGRVILAEGNRELFGKGDIVYLDRGAQDHVGMGHSFHIYRLAGEGLGGLLEEDFIKAYGKGAKDPQGMMFPVGEVVVLSVQPSSSAALVIHSILPLHRGDRVVTHCQWRDRIPKAAPKAAEVKVEERVVERPPEKALEPERKGPTEEELEALRRQEAELRAFTEIDVFFDYDSYALSPEAQEILKGKADWLKRNPTVRVVIEGHCDERGTPSYNLLLGERRAAMVKRYLIQLGVEEGRLSIVSHGENRPLDTGKEEEAWKKNRRVHFVIESQ